MHWAGFERGHGVIVVAGGLIALCWLLARRKAVKLERTGAENALPQPLENRVVVVVVLALATAPAARAGRKTLERLP